jgi:hypothetical protein
LVQNSLIEKKDGMAVTEIALLMENYFFVLDLLLFLEFAIGFGSSVERKHSSNYLIVAIS